MQALICLALLIVAYTLMYQVAWQWGVIDNFFLVERLMDPHYIVRDFYTNSLVGYSPRYFVARFFYYGGKLPGCSYEQFVAWSNIARLIFVEYGIYYLARKLSKSTWVAIVAVALGILSQHLAPPVPGWFFQKPDLTGQSLSLPFALFSLGFFVAESFGASALCAIITILIHPLMGLFLFPVFFLQRISGIERITDSVAALKNLVPMKMWWMSLPVLVFGLNSIIFKGAGGDAGGLSAQEYIDIVIKFRHPHHHLASSFGIRTWICDLIFLATLGLAAFSARKYCSSHKFIYLLVAYYFLICFCGWFFIEIYPMKSMAMVGPYRSFTYYYPFFVIMISIVLVHSWKQKRVIIPILFVLSFAMCPFNARYSFLTLLLGLVLSHPFTRYAWADRLEEKIHGVASRYSQTIILIALLLSAGFAVSSLMRFKISIPDLSAPENLIYKWVQEHTEQDAIIWPEDSVDDLVDQKLRLFSRRAIVVGSDFPFLEKFIKPWYERYLDIKGNVLNPPKPKLSLLSADEIHGTCLKYHVDYLLSNTRLAESPFYSMQNQSENKNVPVYLYHVR